MKTTVRAAIYVDRPPEDVVRVLMDPGKTVLWTAHLERFEVISGSPGEVGSKARLHYREQGRAYQMDDVLVRVEAGRRYLSCVSGEALTAEVETVLTPSGRGTDLAIRWSGRGNTLPMRLLLPFMRRAIQRGALADLEKLKQVVESSSAG